MMLLAAPPIYVTEVSPYFVDISTGRICCAGRWDGDRWLFWWNADYGCWTSWRRMTQEDEKKLAEVVKLGDGHGHSPRTQG